MDFHYFAQAAQAECALLHLSTNDNPRQQQGCATTAGAERNDAVAG